MGKIEFDRNGLIMQKFLPFALSKLNEVKKRVTGAENNSNSMLYVVADGKTGHADAAGNEKQIAVALVRLLMRKPELLAAVREYMKAVISESHRKAEKDGGE